MPERPSREWLRRILPTPSIFMNCRASPTYPTISKAVLAHPANIRDLTPNDPRVHFLFGLVTDKLELPIEARKSLEKALTIDPQIRITTTPWGSFSWPGSGKSADAVAYLAKYVAARPQDARGHFALGVAGLRLGRLPVMPEPDAGSQQRPENRRRRYIFSGTCRPVAGKLR